MPGTMGNAQIFIGEPIENKSETEVIKKLFETSTTNDLEAIILANLHIATTQIDLIYVTEGVVCVIEVKGLNNPVRGQQNGLWEVQVGNGEWVLSRNYYIQVLNAKNSLKDAMQSFLNKGIDYPSSLLLFCPALPNGCMIPQSDFKVGIGSLLTVDFNAYKSGITWSLDDWRAFAKHLGLRKVTLQESTNHQLNAANITLNKYCREFIENYSSQGNRLIHFTCKINHQEIESSEIFRFVDSTHGLLINGPSGCGKSLLAKYIGVEAIKKNHIPIFVEAKYFEGSLRELLNPEAALLGSSSLSEILSACKHLERPLLLIIDGFNECKSTEKERLARSLLAMVKRNFVRIIVTLQMEIDVLYRLNLTSVNVPEPTIELKKAIAFETSDVRELEPLISLLEATRTGLEANLIGEVGKNIPEGASRFSIFDLFVRQKLEAASYDGIQALTRLGKILFDRITFSVTERDFDRLLSELQISPATQKQVLASGLIAKRSNKVSFSHELYLHVFSAEAVVRDSKGKLEEILSSLNSPKHENRKDLIIGAIDDTVLLDKVLTEQEDYTLLVSCLKGDCGEYSRRWAQEQCNITIQRLLEEVTSVKFIVQDNVWINTAKAIGFNSDTLFPWHQQEQQFVAILPLMVIEGKYMHETLEVIKIMDQRLSEEWTNLRPEALNNKIYDLRSQLFHLSYVNSFGVRRLGTEILVSCFESGSLLFGKYTTKISNEVIQFVSNAFKETDLTYGQLYLLLKLSRLINLHSANEQNIAAEHLSVLIKNRWKYFPYHLQLELLTCAEYCGSLPESQRNEIIEAIETIPKDVGWALSSSVVDALQRLGALDESEFQHEEVVRREIEACLSNQNNPKFWNDAAGFFTCLFDHPYHNAYWAVLNELSDEVKAVVFKMALKGMKNRDSMFIPNLIVYVIKLYDTSSAEDLTPFIKIPPKNDPYPQGSRAAFICSEIALGFFGYPVSSLLNTTQDSSENAMLACGELFYWANRKDLADQDRERRMTPAMDILMKHDLGVSLDVIRNCINSLRDVAYFTKELNFRFTETFPKEVAEISRQALKRPEIQKNYYDHDKKKEILQFAIRMLECYGDASDALLIKKWSNDKELGSTAIDAIRTLEQN